METCCLKGSEGWKEKVLGAAAVYMLQNASQAVKSSAAVLE